MPLKQRLYRLLIAPRSGTIDDRRREFMLNTMLTGLLILAVLSALWAVASYCMSGLGLQIENVVYALLFLGMVTVLLWLSRKGKPAVSAVLFILLLLATCLLLIVSWSYRLAQAQLMFAVLIVVASMLFRARLALATALFSIVCLIVAASLQISGAQVPYSGWEDEPFYIIDVVGYVAIFVIIGVISWLSNRETDRSLARAHSNEAAIAKERDGLEQKVIERTRQLEDLQAARLLELQPFAEFGRIGAGLVHDIANPLTAASLHLAALSSEQQSSLVRQVQRSLSELEKYLDAARRQIKRESELKSFAVGAEIKQVAQLMRHRAHRANVRLVVNTTGCMRLYGDVVKFDQLIANLVANAIDASKETESYHPQLVAIEAHLEADLTTIKISDTGTGIQPDHIIHIFEPFYSTKTIPRGGLGLGLSLVKQYVEDDFNGSIQVTSAPEQGTTFVLQLKGHSR